MIICVPFKFTRDDEGGVSGSIVYISCHWSSSNEGLCSMIIISNPSKYPLSLLFSSSWSLSVLIIFSLSAVTSSSARDPCFWVEFKVIKINKMVFRRSLWIWHNLTSLLYMQLTWRASTIIINNFIRRRRSDYRWIFTNNHWAWGE